MAGTLPLLVFFLTLAAIFNEQSKALAKNPFENVILRVLPKPTIGMLNIRRNESGFITEMDGVLPPLMEWLAQRFSFKFIYLQDVVLHTDDSKNGKGAVGYIYQSDRADLLLGAFPDWFPYNQRVDISADWIFQPTGFLIPIPKPSTTGNVAAIVKPFQFYIWMGLFGSIPFVIAVLYLLGLATENMSNDNDLPKETKRKHKDFAIFRQSFNYVVNLISNQTGVACPGRWLSVRVLVGTWCLACFILITAYSSVLISFIVCPNLKPVITSVYDIPKVPGLQVLVDRGSTFYKLMMVPTTVSKYTILTDQWKENPDELQCGPPTKCLDKVRSSTPGAIFIYINFNNILISLMNNQHKMSGECSFMLAKEPMDQARICLFLAKNSPYTEYVNRGVMELMQYGLIHKWEKQFMPQPDRKCLNSYLNPTNTKTRISIDNLSGAFALLLVGWSLAIFAFLFEKIVYYHKLNRKR